MFEVNVTPHEHLDDSGGAWGQPVKGKGADKEDKSLDSADAIALHERLMGFYQHEIERQADARAEMAKDEDFYDGLQWDPADVAVLEERGQVPLVFNVIGTATNWVLGTERKMKIDHHILPRRKEGRKHAQSKTSLYKHVTDANHSHFHYSRAFSEVVRAGLAFLETGYNADSDYEPVFDRMESWRNMIWDSTCIEPDMSDGRYMMRPKWLDVDYLAAKFPNRKALIYASANNAYDSLYGLDVMGDDAMDSREMEYHDASAGGRRTHLTARPRVRAIEAWFKRITPTETMRGGDFHGQIFDPWSPGHVEDLNAGRAHLTTKPKERIWLAVMTEMGLLHLSPSPYRHNRFPFTPLWGNRRARDGMPYGLIRNLRDLQADLNKRASKSLHILSTRRAFVEDGSLPEDMDMEEFREEAARPDPVFVYRSGTQAPRIETDFNLASAHTDLMSRDIEMIQQSSGVTDENLGRRTNAVSGKAITARQTQGQLATAHYFENFAFGRHIHGEKMLSNIEQFYTEQRQFRITNQRGNPEYITINDPNDEESQIAKTKADFIIAEYDWQASYRQAQAEVMFDLASKLAATQPQAVLAILDLLIELMDVPNGEEIVKRVRQLSGMEDPDADPNNPDPETIARQEAKAKEAAFMEEMAVTELAERKGKAEEALAKARKLAAEATEKEMAGTGRELENLQKAINAAAQVFGQMGVAQIADQLLRAAQANATAGAAQSVAPAAQPMPPMPPAAQMPPPQQPQPMM